MLPISGASFLRLILVKPRCAFSGFADSHRIQYQNVFKKGCGIGHEATLSFTYEKWDAVSALSRERRKGSRSS